MEPILTLLCSPIIFHEKLTGRKLIAGGIVAAGLVCISGSIALSGMNMLGLLIAVISALLYAALIGFNKQIICTTGLQTAAIELSVAAVVTFIYTICTAGFPHPAGSDIPYIAAISIVNTGLMYLLYFSGIRSTSSKN